MNLFNKISDKEKRTFLPLAEHKLKTPVAGLKWNIELLLGDSNLSKEAKETLQDIHKINEKTVKTLTDFFIIMRIREDKLKSNPEKINIAEKVKTIIKDKEKQINEKALNIELKLDESTLEVDSNLFELFVSNLVSNSILFNKNNGKLNIELSGADNEIHLRIKDTGIGIPQEEIDRVLELFYRASNASETSGTGLGLAIVNSLVTGWGGKINIESEINVGTTVSVQLPLKTKSEFKLITINNG